MQAALAKLAAEGVTADRIADLSVSIWHDVDAAFSPIIGQGGFAALYKRSLYLTRPEHSCLATVYEGDFQPGEFAGLQTALSRETSVTAAAANGALLQTFHDLLVTLIGEALTDQLLRSVLNNPALDNPALHHSSGGHAAQDTSP